MQQKAINAWNQRLEVVDTWTPTNWLEVVVARIPVLGWKPL